MQTSWRTEALPLFLIVIMFAVAGIVWPYAPERMPVHWNLQGQPDRYGGRFEGLLLTPLIALGLYAMFLVLPWIDPRRANYAAFARGYAAIKTALLLFMAVLQSALMLVAFGYHVDIGLVIPCAVGVLFCILGNFMGTFRPNWFVGVRTPWTLSSALSWKKTHRVAGRMFIATGLVMFLLGFMHNVWVLAALLMMIAAMVIWLPLYSYLVWRDDPERAGSASGS